MIYIFYILIFLFLYPYFIYPIILFILGKFIKYEYKFDNSLEPKVSVVISVYNEEELIIDCIKSILNSNYNIKNIEIFIGSDGSSDNTNQIVKDFIKSYENIYFYEFGRSGKNLVLNNLMKHVKTDYVFYMDADIRITKDAIKNSIIYLADNNVGLVISRMIQIKSENYEPNLTLTTLKSIEAQFNTGLLGESFYQKYEHYLRLWSSNISTSVNSLGAFYLMKMSLYEPIANEKVCDDYYTVLTALVNQKKVMYNDNSIVFEVRKKQISDEMQRRIRLTAGSLSTLYIKKQILNPLFGFSSLFTWSNKLLRIISPIFFILAVIFAYFVLKSDINIFYYKTFFEGLLILFVFSTIFDKLGSNLNINLKIFKIYRYFIIMNFGYLLGIYEFLKGKHNSKWGHNI